MFAAIGTARGQGGPVASDAVPGAVPGAASPTTPAEIQPGHRAAGTAQGAPIASGPQSAVPAPLPPGTRPDTPGGSARAGVIVPPAAAGDPAINKGVPRAGAPLTPVIPPPGTPGGNPSVVPK